MTAFVFRIMNNKHKLHDSILDTLWQNSLRLIVLCFLDFRTICKPIGKK